jgi:deazaflavin-dependent oxidoreductase (nitroreductase family)
MRFPRGLARFNRHVTNPIQRTFAWLVPPWAVIVHRGRRSGRGYRTPVLAFRRGSTVVVALVYGEESDWLRNLRSAGGGRVIRAGRLYRVGPPTVVRATDAAVLPRLSPPERTYCRLAEKVAVLEIAGRQPGFGPHRAAP